MKLVKNERIGEKLGAEHIRWQFAVDQKNEHKQNSFGRFQESTIRSKAFCERSCME